MKEKKLVKSEYCGEKQKWYFYLVLDFTLQIQKPTQHSPKELSPFYTHKCLYCLPSHNLKDVFDHATGKVLT